MTRTGLSVVLLVGDEVAPLGLRAFALAHALPFFALTDGLALLRPRQVPPLSTDEVRRHLHCVVDAELTSVSSQ